MHATPNTVFSVIIFTLLNGTCFGTAAQTIADDSEPGDSEQDEIIVWGRDTDLSGSAESASQGVVGYADFSTRPMLRVGELVEVVPGMIAAQHSGEGKANQYFLRGMNLDHGSDFSVSIDGMPVNFRSHAHAQGYLDLNFIIPEIIETVEFRKGPYYADVGDFSAAGTAAFKTYNSLSDGFVKVIVGSNAYLRLVGANSFTTDSGTVLLAGEYFTNDGPWDLPQDQQKVNAYLKYTADNGLQISVSFYDNEWNATDQIPQREVDAGNIGRFGFVDPFLGGSSERLSIVANKATENSDFNAYATHYELNLFSNPTYALADPVNGDQIEQEDRRWVFGGSWDFAPVSNGAWLPRMGAELRLDAADKVNLFNTVKRQRTTTVRDDSVDVLSAAVYGDIEYQFTNKLRITAGLRADLFDFSVDSALIENSGSGSETIVTPKFSLAYLINEELELYANYGRGFHSNDARAVTITIDPVTGEPATPFDAVSPAEGAEIGLRRDNWHGLTLTVAAFVLELDSELIFVGDAGTTEPNDATKRRGVELSAFWNPTDEWTVDFTYAKTHARFKNGDHIPDAHETIAGAGITYTGESGLTASIRARHFGDAALNEDNSVRKDAATTVNFGIDYEFERFGVGLEVLNVFDANNSDIEYLFESQLPGEVVPVQDIHFHPMESLSVRAIFSWKL